MCNFLSRNSRAREELPAANPRRIDTNLIEEFTCFKLSYGTKVKGSSMENVSLYKFRIRFCVCALLCLFSRENFWDRHAFECKHIKLANTPSELKRYIIKLERFDSLLVWVDENKSVGRILKVFQRKLHVYLYNILSNFSYKLTYDLYLHKKKTITQHFIIADKKV